MTEVQRLLTSSSLPPDALAGRTAIVTGAGRGIGRCLTEALARLGARVVVAEIDAEAGAAAARTIREALGRDDAARFVPTDVGDEASIDACVAASECVDIVVNNAAVAPLGAVADTELGVWDTSYRVNLRGPVAFARATVPAMRARGYGVFVTVSSVGGAFMGPYECMKTAGVELAATLATELEGTGVFAFSIGPGQVMTPGLVEALDRLAPMYGLTTDAFLALNAEHLMSAAEAGVGIAAAVALAERFHGAETSSVAGLTAAGVVRPALAVGAEPLASNEGARALPPEAAEAARRVRTTFAEQVAGWRARGLFERKWMERDFRRHTGSATAEALEALDAVVAALDAGEAPRHDVLVSLRRYYDRYERLARDHTRDAAALATALEAIARWRDEVDRLADLLPDSVHRSPASP
jgi:NAD(P)-dependent dehydrogenase (short-subunit alcohol dehydrogenase family)